MHACNGKLLTTLLIVFVLAVRKGGKSQKGQSQPPSEYDVNEVVDSVGGLFGNSQKRKRKESAGSQTSNVSKATATTAIELDSGLCDEA